jgi:predicted nucleic acid-binding protein
MRFVDTNILLYFVSGAPIDAAKRATAAALLDREDLCLSVQVLQEFYVQATRATRVDPLEHGEALDLIASWKRYPIQDITLDLLERALAAKAHWGISYWDAAVIEAARLMGCAELLSEDLADGQDYGGIRVVNPFRAKI